MRGRYGEVKGAGRRAGRWGEGYDRGGRWGEEGGIGERCARP